MERNRDRWNKYQTNRTERENKPGVAGYAYSYSTQETEAENDKFQASLSAESYAVRIKNKKQANNPLQTSAKARSQLEGHFPPSPTT